MRIEDTGRQTQDRMKIRSLQELFTDRFSGTAFKKYIIRDYYGSGSIIFQERADMLYKIELFIGGGSPEILPVIGKLLFALGSIFIGDGDAASFAEWRIGQYIGGFAEPPNLGFSVIICRFARTSSNLN